MKNSSIEIKVCMGTSGMASGGADVLRAFKQFIHESGIEAQIGKRCDYKKVGCRGFCSKDVLVDVVINGEKTTYQSVKPIMVERIVSEHIVNGEPISEWLTKEDYESFHNKQYKIVLSPCGEIDPENIEDYLNINGYKAAKKAITQMSRDDVIKKVIMSGLRGRGGSGFLTGRKWEICKNQHENPKYIICNVGEVNRPLAEGNPHAIIEGLLIGGYAIGAEKGYIYIRERYHISVERLRTAISQAREKGFIGKNIFNSGFSFDIDFSFGTEAFICGEETALMESIEGKRAMPRFRPPFPAQKGLWGKPTIINNAETFSNIPIIIGKGAKWYSSIGTKESKGTKVFTLSGKVKNIGLVEIPMGMSLRDIVYGIGGGVEGDKALKAVQVGGPSGGLIPVSMIDMGLDYESLSKVGSIVGSGGMVVFDEDDCIVSVTKFFIEFLHRESCGKCTPCRIGTKRMLELLTKITEGKGEDSDLETLERLSSLMTSSSLCGLGRTAPNPFITGLSHFRDEYIAHIRDKKCPAVVCTALITFTIIEELCKGCGACLRACPAGAITGEKKKPHHINQELCIKCGACFKVCKFKAIKKE
ncbi:MAG: NADH-ubiquinone oxidoreductase-F iron-sulfur binding region domain-containing protein [Thermodesulfovibrionales bacterium]|jgi:NADH-quinone oxidoreductase subunit F|nr:NADH-ubiquinone oxidoreductase-F iron-sulfur binding region domain-containing protein [Thermodesulfovibrionales bacterium]